MTENKWVIVRETYFCFSSYSMYAVETITYQDSSGLHGILEPFFRSLHISYIRIDMWLRYMYHTKNSPKKPSKSSH